jgi:hypothetical protein
MATAHLDNILSKINLLEKGDHTSYIVTSPKNWFVVGYKQSEISKSPGLLGAPEVCGNRDCLCICPANNNPQQIIVGVSVGGIDYGAVAENAFYSSIKNCPEARAIPVTMDNSGFFSSGWSAIKSISLNLKDMVNKPNFCFRELCGSKGVCRPVSNLSVDANQQMVFEGSDLTIRNVNPLFVPWVAIGDPKHSATEIEISKDSWGGIKISANVPLVSNLQNYSTD